MRWCPRRLAYRKESWDAIFLLTECLPACCDHSGASDAVVSVVVVAVDDVVAALLAGQVHLVLSVGGLAEADLYFFSSLQ